MLPMVSGGRSYHFEAVVIVMSYLPAVLHLRWNGGGSEVIALRYSVNVRRGPVHDQHDENRSDTVTVMATPTGIY
jgi:hypothetical protein